MLVILHPSTLSFPLEAIIIVVIIIGASLSEPHTSVTALSTCVCIYACLLGPTTYREFQMSAFKILIFHCDVHADEYFS